MRLLFSLPSQPTLILSQLLRYALSKILYVDSTSFNVFYFSRLARVLLLLLRLQSLWERVVRLPFS